MAAGRGERLGYGGPKALVELNGRPMLEWSIAALAACPEVAAIVVALPEGASAPAGCTGVRGGAVRSASVRAALAAAPAESEVVLVHDAARPLVTSALIAEVLAALEGADCAIAATPVTDTVKEVEAGVVVRTLDRSRLWSVQTPQAFRRAALERVLALPGAVVDAATDEASLIEHSGGRVRVVPAPAENLKVTTRRDLRLAEQLLAERA